MRLFSWFIVLFSLALLPQVHGQEQGLYALKCEHIVSPISIDVANPRFSWKIKDERHGASQASYRVTVSAAETENLLWDSGVKSGNVRLMRYEGASLSSFTAYEFTVEAWDENGLAYPMQSGKFETSFLPGTSWPGQWIDDGKSMDYRPASYFRKDFQANKEIKSARLHIAAAGYAAVFMNGTELDQKFLNPAFTNYEKRVLFDTYDLTDYVLENKNAVGIIMGNGWYNHQVNTVWAFDEAPWRGRPGFIAHLTITYVDGSVETIDSDQSWKVHESPIQFNSIYFGENYDFNKEIIDWSSPAIDVSDWEAASLMEAPTETITGQRMQAVKKMKTLKPVLVDKKSDRQYVFHFSKNIAGTTRIRGTGQSGTDLSLTHGEVLLTGGFVNNFQFASGYTNANYNEQFHADFITLADGDFDFTPRFNYKGFQYMEVKSDQPIQLDENSVEAYHTYTSLPEIGTLRTSNTIINKIWEAANSSYLSNAIGIPTDCPQREKNGWTGDAHIIAESGLFNYEGILFYEKWMRDHQDAQESSGALPSIIPTSGFGYTDYALDWTSSSILIPWDVYTMTGDKTILEENYDMMKKFLGFYIRASRGYMISGGYGDWSPVIYTSNLDFTSSSYFFKAAKTLAKIAFEVRQFNDFEYFSGIAEKIKSAINQRFYSQNEGIYGTGTQTELSIALDFDIVEEANFERVGRKLAERIEANDGLLDVGLLGSKSLLDALIKIGRKDLAFNILKETRAPSWGNWIKLGLTTLPEGWIYYPGYPFSSNHGFFGEVSSWMYRTLAGINAVENNPGFKEIALKPHFDYDLGQIEISHDSPYGLISVEVAPENEETFLYKVDVPVGSTAFLHSPAGFKIVDFEGAGLSSENIPEKDENNVIHFGSGHYEFKFSKENLSAYPFPILPTPELIQHGEFKVEDGRLVFVQGETKAVFGQWNIIDNAGRSLKTRAESISFRNLESVFITDLEAYRDENINLKISITYETGETITTKKRLKLVN